MKSRIFAIAVALLLAQPAAAQMKTLAEAHEVVLSELRLPGTESGTIGFKPCEECEYRTERVSPETVYLVNDRRVSLDEFSKALSGVNKREATYVTVLHHLERNIVTRVWVTLQ
jgi:hypothetical protein